MVDLVGQSFDIEDCDVDMRIMDSHNTHRCFGMKIWLVKDVCGIICAVFTYWLMIFAQYVILVTTYCHTVSTLLTLFSSEQHDRRASCCQRKIWCTRSPTSSFSKHSPFWPLFPTSVPCVRIRGLCHEAQRPKKLSNNWVGIHFCPLHHSDTIFLQD